MKPAGNSARLAEGPIGKAVFSMMVPMLLGMIAMVVNNLAGAIFVARISIDQLAAISFTFPVSFIVASVAMALGVGTSSVASRLFGQGKRDDVRRITGHAMLLAVASGGVLLTIGLLTIDPLFRLLGADDHMLPIIHSYMRIYYWGGIFVVAPMIANSVLRAAGDARRPAMIMTAAAVLNICLDAILIFGLFGFPRMEIRGAALGAVLSNAVMLLASGYFVMHREHLVSFRHFMPELITDSWRRILHVGLPSMATSIVAPLTSLFITAQVAHFGHEAVAGAGMAGRIEGLTLMAMMSLSAALTPFTGQNFGAGRLDRVEQGVRFAYRLSLFYGATIAVIMFIAGGWLADLSKLAGGAKEAALLQMHIVPVSYMALGCSMAVNGALNALGKPMVAMFVSLSRTILVYVPLAWLLPHFFGLPGIFMAAATANFISGGIGIAWFRLAFKETVADYQAKTVAQRA